MALGKFSVLSIAIACALAWIGLGSQAQAATITAPSGTGAYPCVSTSSLCSTRLGTFPKGAAVEMRCWYDGRTAKGAYSSNRWFLVRASGGYEGFAHSSWVGSQTKVDWCGNSLRVKAGLEAAARVGRRNAKETKDEGLFAPADWSPGPLGEWSGDCVKFAWVAYKRAGKELTRANAWPAFSSHYSSGYSERGRSKVPPYGALVGWQWNPGHIAVSLGWTHVATTIGLDGANAPISLQNLGSSTSFGGSGFYGWTVPRK